MISSNYLGSVINYMYGIFSKPYFNNLNFFLDLQQIWNYKNSIIKKIRRNSIVAKKKRKKPSSPVVESAISGVGLVRKSDNNLGTLTVILAILFFFFTISNTTSNKMTRIETQLEPIVKANLPLEISKLKSSVNSINKILDSQSDLINHLSPTQNFFTQAKGITIIRLNPTITDGVKIFLEKMQDEEFIKIRNSSKSKTQKVIEIIAKIGGIEKLMDLLETKDSNLSYGVVALFVEDYAFNLK